MTDTPPDKITLKEHPEEFRKLCREQDIEYLSTVHYFQKDVYGIYDPVYWGNADTAASRR